MEISEQIVVPADAERTWRLVTAPGNFQRWYAASLSVCCCRNPVTWSTSR
ncbi:hypothetical protein ACFWY9_00980 [Amycolatopsis sp. NPDC059027]